MKSMNKHDVASKQAERERIKREVDAFLAKGGKIKRAEPKEGNRDGLTISRHKQNTHLFQQ